jgi:tetratricopeptide (TPR) repeat protein
MGGKSLSGYEKNRFFHNRGGIFHEEGARHGLDSTRDGRGIAVADFDQDGREDLFVANANALPALYHDRAPAAGHWAAFRLEGRRSSRDGVGARLLLTAGGRRLLRFVDGGNGFAGQSSRRVHFGLASAAAVERLEVVWPSGVRQTFSGFAADRMYRVVEGEPELRLFTPASAGPAAAAPPSNPYEQARALVAAGQAEAALPHFEAALAADPDSLRYASDYRQAVIRAGAYDRALDVFAQLVEKHPRSHNAWLNYGYAYVDKIPAAGSISQLILANQALDKFSKAIEIERSWLALYTRGNAYLYWPAVFGCAPLAVADLEEAVAISKGEPKRSVHVHAYVALGDGYWKTDQPEKARATWREAAGLFPGDPRLQARLARDGEELSAYIYDQLDPNQRVDTDLSPLWQE